ncbi:hypothetical protein KSP40_PGU009606 [Platanthera guangdongensis]|uniref:Uncharacterized protein n=1 Tax=Platanthera guangdongensis TaxID=2320717 RepID=A0ABR2MJ68_9ASPA
METMTTDYILVPLGFIIMVGYHVWLLHRIIHYSTKPITNINSIRNYIPVMDRVMATTMMAWATIMLGSLVALLMANAHCLKQISDREMPDRAGTEHAVVMKFFCLTAYLLAAFLLSVQMGRHYFRANLLMIAVQARYCRPHQRRVPMEYSVASVSDWEEEGQEKKKTTMQVESVKLVDVAEKKKKTESAFSRHDREISTVELLEIIVVKAHRIPLLSENLNFSACFMTSINCRRSVISVGGALDNHPDSDYVGVSSST